MNQTIKITVEIDAEKFREVVAQTIKDAITKASAEV